MPKGTNEGRAASVDNAWYSIYVLFVVGLVSILTYYDRFLMTILVEPIKRDLSISDGQIGLLAGLGFALIYGVMSIPMARLADRYGRGQTLGAVLMFWSAMTAATGAAVNLPGIALARIGVGVGEAGSLPTVHALIAEHFPPRRRGLALSTSGVCGAIGVSLSLVVGGHLNDLYGWRTAFYVASVPGLILAPLILLTIRGPRVQRYAASAPITAAPLRVALSTLCKRKAFVLLCLGVGIGTIGSYGQQAWNPAFLMRTYHFSASEVGSRYAAVVGPASIISILIGGALNDWLVSKDKHWPFWVLALSFGLSTPAGLAFYLIHNFAFALAISVLSTMLGYLWIGPAYALVQSLAGQQFRALAAAVFMLVINVVGGAVGPAAIGLLSDRLTATFGDRSLAVSLCIVIMTCAIAVIPFLMANRTVEADMADANS